jgi:hypothetical protein
VAAGKVLIGHYTARNGWVIDASATATLLAGTTYALGVSLKGSTVSVTVNSQAIVGFVFHSVTVDGKFGFFATGAAATFDDAVTKTNDSKFATTAGALLSDPAAQVQTASVTALTGAALAPIVSAAKARWVASGELDQSQLARLERATVSVGELTGGALGLTTGEGVTIDALAGGHGWFVDSSPLSDQAVAFDGIDLLTVVMHELGHVMGYEHDDVAGDLMEPALLPGIRRLPFAGNIATPIVAPHAPVSPAAMISSSVRGRIVWIHPALQASWKPAKPLRLPGPTLVRRRTARGASGR